MPSQKRSATLHWQAPDADDVLLANPRIVDALRPIARSVFDSAVTSWWTDPLDPDDQFFVAGRGRRRRRRRLARTHRC